MEKLSWGCYITLGTLSAMPIAICWLHTLPEEAGREQVKNGDNMVSAQGYQMSCFSRTHSIFQPSVLGDVPHFKADRGCQHQGGSLHLLLVFVLFALSFIGLH